MDETTQELARFVIDWMQNLGGFDAWWHGIDPEDQQELTSSLATAIDRHNTKKPPEL